MINHFDEEIMDKLHRDARIIAFITPIIIGLVSAFVIGFPLYLIFFR